MKKLLLFLTAVLLLGLSACSERNVSVTGVELNYNTATLVIGETKRKVATVLPGNATNQNITWTSSNPAVAEVDANGTVTAVSPGTAIITVTTQDGGRRDTSTVTVNPPNISVTGVSLNITEATLAIGATKTLIPAIAPTNATNQSVTWNSSNPNVVFVDNNGRITTIAAGTADITVTTVDGGFSATSRITVDAGITVIAVTGVSLNTTETTLTVNESETLTATIAPGNATNQNVAWTSSNPTVVSVDQNGRITAVTPGTATITVTTEDGRFTATCIVTVAVPAVPVASVSLNITEVALTAGETETLVPHITPTNATNQNVSWRSNNANVATVDAYGQITAVSAGVAVITVTTECGARMATCIVTVIPATVSVTGVSLNRTETTLIIGEAETLTATVVPANADNQNVWWWSDDTNVAIVDDYGRITAVSVGTTTITVTTEDGNFTAICVVTVTERAPTQGGVVINGIEWATRNVDAPGTFAGSPEESGMFYQWNRRIGWCAIIPGEREPVAGWDYSNPPGTVWTRANDPCPPGWRVPTYVELESLWDAGSTWTTQNGVGGLIFGTAPNQIFLPAAGARCCCSGELHSVGTNGFYWSSTQGGTTSAWSLHLNSWRWSFNYSRTIGLSVRCVADNLPLTAVTNVSLNRSSISLVVGENEILTAIVAPAGATNRNVSWTSSNLNVATVDFNGRVTAVSPGTATITVTTEDGGRTATATVTVNAPIIRVTGVSLNIEDYMPLAVGTTKTLIATLSPANATNRSVTWTSSDPTVACVDDNGVVTAVSAGWANITVTTADGGYTATADVLVTSISIDCPNNSLTVGETITLNASVYPTWLSVSWRSSNSSVATVDAWGNITAVSAGTTIITATSEYGLESTCIITVAPEIIRPVSISLNRSATTLTAGNTETLIATVLPENATNRNVTWSSNNNSVATVNNNGLVTAHAAGTATITATTQDGGLTANSIVTVIAMPTHIEVQSTPNNMILNSGEAANFQWAIPTGGSPGGITYLWQQSSDGVNWTDAPGTNTERIYTTLPITADTYFRRLTTDNLGVTFSTISVRITLDRTVWATSNVAAPGTFAANPQDAGMFFQWNRRQGWPATGDVIGWPTTSALGETWARENDPCPTGWRVPTIEEFTRLIRRESQLVTNWNGTGVNGVLFNVPPNQIFLPEVGWRWNTGGLSWERTGRYWSSSTAAGVGRARHFQFSSINVMFGSDSSGRAYGLPVRCVAE